MELYQFALAEDWITILKVTKQNDTILRYYNTTGASQRENLAYHAYKVLANLTTKAMMH